MRCIPIVILSLLLSTLMGCSEKAPELVIYNASPRDEDCGGKIIEDVFQAAGYYDIFCGNTYRLWFEVWSYLIERSDTERPRAETNLVKLDRAEIHLTTTNQQEIFPTYSVPIAATVVPGEAEDPGKSVVLIDIIPGRDDVMSRLDSFADNEETIIANIKVFGTTTGDVDVESAWFQFPIIITIARFSVFLNNCEWTEEVDEFFDEISSETCQTGGGYDGDLCWCNAQSSGERCEQCPYFH